jgi:hypothetical protein
VIKATLKAAEAECTSVPIFQSFQGRDQISDLGHQNYGAEHEKHAQGYSDSAQNTGLSLIPPKHRKISTLVHCRRGIKRMTLQQPKR